MDVPTGSIKEHLQVHVVQRIHTVSPLYPMLCICNHKYVVMQTAHRRAHSSVPLHAINMSLSILDFHLQLLCKYEPCHDLTAEANLSLKISGFRVRLYKLCNAWERRWPGLLSRTVHGLSQLLGQVTRRKEKGKMDPENSEVRTPSTLQFRQNHRTFHCFVYAAILPSQRFSSVEEYWGLSR